VHACIAKSQSANIISAFAATRIIYLGAYAMHPHGGGLPLVQPAWPRKRNRRVSYVCLVAGGQKQINFLIEPTSPRVEPERRV